MTQTRRNVYALGNAEIASLRKGFAAMDARDPASPISWRFQANIHGTFDHPDPMVNGKKTFNQCQHGSFFFLSWHRMYLYWFERILRAAAGDPNLTLPYWDYSNTAQGAIPEPYRNPADHASNPLYIKKRNVRVNSGQALPTASTSWSAAFSYMNFCSRDGSALSFGGLMLDKPSDVTDTKMTLGQLENQPHNAVHDLVGGLMEDHETAARDPIFFAHHANIDRLWKRWLDQGGGRSDPVDNDAWMKSEFRFFDEIGDPQMMKGADILDTVAQLGYRYDDDPPPFKTTATSGCSKSAHRPERQVLESHEGFEAGEANTVVFKMTLAKLFGLIGEKPGHRVALRVEVQGRCPTGVIYQIYLNPPEQFTPDHQNVRCVGNLATFGMAMVESHAGHQMGSVFEFDLSPNVRTLGGSEEHMAQDPLTIHFVAKGFEAQKAGEGKLRVERISVFSEAR